VRRSQARTAVLVVLGVVLAVNLALAAVARLTRGPEGPASSSYATAPEGVAAYADLLARNGHPVGRLRDPLDEAELDPASTLVLLDPGLLGPGERAALARFVAEGGVLVAGGDSPGRWAAELLEEPPVWSPGGPTSARTVAPGDPVRGVEEVESAGVGVWEDAGEALPVLAGGQDVVAVVAARERGRMTLLADTSILQNRLLGRANNAAFGLAAAGEPRRPVVFVESVHGYGRASGLAAIPTRWAWALGGLGLAALLLMWARGRRLGPPEERERDLPPPRLEYVESLAAVLARTKRPGEAAHPLQAAARRRLVRRAGLPADASDDALRRAAAGYGLTEEERAAAFGHVRDAAGLAAAGRALARLEDGGRP
jgi:hypothetical protein